MHVKIDGVLDYYTYNKTVIAFEALFLSFTKVKESKLNLSMFQIEVLFEIKLSVLSNPRAHFTTFFSWIAAVGHLNCKTNDL